VRVPLALRWLLLAVGVAGVIWALAVPAWQVPDEDSHFAYVQSVAELHRRPADNGRPITSTEQMLAEDASGFRRSYQRLETNPQWTAAAEARWKEREVKLSADDRRDGGGPASSRHNPPTFYLYSALAYEASGGSIIDRLYAMRLWSVPLLLIFVVSTWLLAGELAGRERIAQLCAGALAGLAPMVTFISSSVNPDAMMWPLWGLATWVGVRGLRRGFTPRSVVALVALALAAVAVKPVAVALLPGVLWVLGVALWRRRGLSPPSRRAVAWVVGAIVTIGVAVVLALSPRGPVGLADYLWQFYLPELADQTHIRQLDQWPLRDVWYEGVTGAFGWLEVRFPPLASAGLAVGMLGLAALAVRGLRGRRDVVMAVFLLLPALSLLVGLHVVELRYIEFQHEGFIQGRYMLPLLPLAASAVAAGVATLRSGQQATLSAALLGGLVFWQLGALAIVMARFYA
jgi:4-amino-4-deoxy-L-arabinose transferase-like glycosyltransferase